MKKRALLQVFAVMAMLMVAAGCASRRADVLARIMAEMDAEGSGEAASDAPAATVSGLPPAPLSAAGHTTTTRGGLRSALTIQPECLVRVTVEEDESLDGSFPVNEIGAIDFGRIGPVFLQNCTEGEASEKIRERLLKRDFRKATVKVEIARASYDKVLVSGAVSRPGLIRIGAGAEVSLNDALLRAGGPRTTAKGTKVKIVRDGQLFAMPNVLKGEEYFLVDEEGKADVPQVSLLNNDIAFVFSTRTEPSPIDQGEKVITVLGEVKRQGNYRFAANETCTIMHLIFKMGGLPAYADQKRIKISRRDKEGIDEEIDVNADKVLDKGNPDEDFPLEDGDRVIVPARGIRIF